MKQIKTASICVSCSVPSLWVGVDKASSCFPCLHSYSVASGLHAFICWGTYSWCLHDRSHTSPWNVSPPSEG